MLDLRQAIAEQGLDDLPDDVLTDLTRSVLKELERRAGTRIADRLSAEQLAEFQLLVRLDRSAAVAWLNMNVPDHQVIAREETETILREVRGRADDIRAAAGLPPR